MRELAPDMTERNYAREPLRRAEIEKIARAVGDLTSLLNGRHRAVKAAGWMDKPPSRAALVRAVMEDPNVIRRPVILRGNKAIVSRDEAEIRRFLS